MKNPANFTNRKIFLLKCRATNTIPKHIFSNIHCVMTLQIEDHPYKKLIDHMMTSFKKQILNLEIKIITFWKLKQIEHNIRCTIEGLAKILSKVTIDNFSQRMSATYEATLLSVKERNRKKYERLSYEKSMVIPTTKKNFSSIIWMTTFLYQQQ